MIDRTIQPKIYEFEDFKMAREKKQLLPNGIELYLLNNVKEDVVRIDWMFRAGTCYQDQKLTAYFTNALIKEGSQSMTSAEIAEKLDFYGSWLQLSSSHHYAYITLYVLNRHLPSMLSLAEEMIFHATLPEKEYATLKEILRKKMEIDQKKVEYIASKEFKKALYGTNHLYGQYASIEDIDALPLEKIRNFYHKHYNTQNCKIFVTGNISPESETLLINAFSKIENSGTPLDDYCAQSPIRAQEKRIFIEKNDAVQSAVIMGKPLIDRHHPDYAKLNLLNVAFGGYFGSRLMTNIREEKGYTYGISSSLTAFSEYGHFSIISQTATEYTEQLIQEVFNEIDKIRCSPIPEEELDMVKMYLLGEHLRTMDGGLNIADLLISLVGHKQDYDFYDNIVETIKKTTSKELLALAQKYLNPEEFYVVVAGRK